MMNQYMQKKLQNIDSEHYEYKFGVNDVFNLLNSSDNQLSDEPFGDASSLPMMLLSQKTKSKSA